MVLVRYKPMYEKTAMGMLALMPSEKDLIKLRQTISEYQEEETYKLHLWKEAEDVVGIVGFKQEDENGVIMHVSVTPSHRQQGIGKAMLMELQKVYPSLKFKGNTYTACFVAYLLKESIGLY